MFKSITCLVDCATTHLILKDLTFFKDISPFVTCVNIISRLPRIIEGSGQVIVFLLNKTKLLINEALFSPKSQRNLISFKDICTNEYHLEIGDKDGKEYLFITSQSLEGKAILEILPTHSFGLYRTTIYNLETHALVDL